MIFEALWNTFVTVTQTLFSILPSLPDTPSALETASNAVTGYLAPGVYILRYIFTTALLNIALGVFLAVFVFERGYTTIMFVLRKLPFINIK